MKGELGPGENDVPPPGHLRTPAKPPRSACAAGKVPIALQSLTTHYGANRVRASHGGVSAALLVVSAALLVAAFRSWRHSLQAGSPRAVFLSLRLPCVHKVRVRVLPH